MQPNWRKQKNWKGALPPALYSDNPDDWEDLCCFGVRGFADLLVSLSWWVLGTQGAPWKKAVLDITRVLEGLLGMSTMDGKNVGDSGRGQRKRKPAGHYKALAG
jgi:hypothetical protein